METISKLESDSIFLLTLGGILLFGLITATLGRQKVPASRDAADNIWLDHRSTGLR